MQFHLARHVSVFFRDGQLVPSSIMVALVKEAILKDETGRFLLDGFPRSKDNLEAWFEDFSDDEIQVKKLKLLLFQGVGSMFNLHRLYSKYRFTWQSLQPQITWQYFQPQS